MGRNDIRIHIICRMLHRGKGVDVLTVRKNDNSSRMLPCTSPDSRTSLYDPVDLTVSLPAAPLFIIVLHKSECGLVRQGTDGPRAERLPFSKDDFRIL